MSASAKPGPYGVADVSTAREVQVVQGETNRDSPDDHSVHVGGHRGRGHVVAGQAAPRRVVLYLVVAGAPA